MLKKIALAAVLVQVAIFSALTTQTVLFASTANQAADARPGDPVSVTGGRMRQGDVAKYSRSQYSRSLP
ncbi:hypothetical protein [Mesorhizobium sp. M1406]|uniref:hypothetical protein n=1 Tax=Mesorhizobium sp. M1406 TaxID=2957099 RepID=UPI003337F97B